MNDSAPVLGSGHRKLFALFGAVLFLGTALYASRDSLPPSPAVAQEPKPVPPATTTSRVVDATKTFLDALDADRRTKVLFPLETQKPATAAKFKGGKGGNMTFVGEKYGEAVWSNFPVDDVPRPGLRLGGLTAGQRDAAMKLLRVLLSPKGYEKVVGIMGADQVLADGGTAYLSGKDVYTIGVFGEPSETEPWMLQFGGHHLGLNVLIAGNKAVMTPTLTGVQPALYKSGDKTVRPLAGENDKAFALLGELDEKQRKQAVLDKWVPDLVLGPGRGGEKVGTEGLKGSAMTEKQRALLLDLVAEWAGILNDDYAKPRLDEIKAGLDDTYFVWCGSTTREEGKNGTAYYRIQGPKLVIEFSPQGGPGGATMHVHTVYRDPTNEYGRALTK